MNKNFKDRLLKVLFKQLPKALLIFTVIFLVAVLVDKRSITAAKVGGYNALKLIEKARVSEFTQEFQIHQTDHFILKYKESDEDIVTELGEMFERAYSMAGQAYDYYPTEKTNVLIYPTKDELDKYQPSLKGQNVMGLYSAGTIHILSPKAYLYDNSYNFEHQNDYSDFLQSFEKDGPILHEYIHSVVDSLTGGNVELWLTEGLALYEEYAMFGTEWAEGFEYEHYYSLDELQNSFGKLDEMQSYRQSFDIVKYIVENHGREKVLELLTEMKELKDFDTAFENVYGESEAKKMKTGGPVFQ